MKRYVKELANDLLRGKHCQHKEEIERIICLCKRGFITDFEAVRMMVKVKEETKVDVI